MDHGRSWELNYWAYGSQAAQRSPLSVFPFGASAAAGAVACSSWTIGDGCRCQREPQKGWLIDNLEGWRGGGLSLELRAASAIELRSGVLSSATPGW